MKLVWLVVLAGCATVGSVSSLEQEASACDDFAQFDARAKRLLDEQLGNGGTDALELNGRVNAARQSCARAVMGSLLTLRIERGPEAAQQQLDAMALSLSEAAFARLISESPSDSNLRAMATLAAATAATHRTNEARSGHERKVIQAWQVEAPTMSSQPELEVNDAHECEALGPDAALACLGPLTTRVLVPAERARLHAAIRAVAMQKVQSLELIPPGQRAVPLSKWVARLDALEVDEPRVREALEASRQALWPEVDEAVRAGRLEQAAVLAEPFLVLSAARREVERLRENAATHQEQLARQAGPHLNAAAFHRQLAARFSGSASSWPEHPGQWDTTRYQCARPPGALPSAEGLSLRLVATCKRSKRSPDAVQPTDAKMQTFEAERSLEWENIDGTLFVSCASRVLSFRFNSRDLAVDTGENESVLRDEPGIGAAPHSALSLELEKVIKRAVPECKAARAQLVASDCTKMSSSEAVDLEERFTEHALALKAWPTCFVQWLNARVGVAPPAL